MYNRFKWIKSDYYVIERYIEVTVCFRCVLQPLCAYVFFFPLANSISPSIDVTYQFRNLWHGFDGGNVCVACCVNVIYLNRSRSDALTSHAHAHIFKMAFECLICRMAENKYWSSQFTNNRTSVCVFQIKWVGFDLYSPSSRSDVSVILYGKRNDITRRHVLFFILCKKM